MCQYLVFFILSFSTFAHNQRLLQNSAVGQERRDLGMFGHHVEKRYGDYFTRGHHYRNRRRRSHRHQTPVGDQTDIELHKLPGHFPFDKKDGDNWETILEKSKQEADAMAAKAKAEDDAEMKKQDEDEKAEKKDEDEKEKAEEAKNDDKGKSKDKGDTESGPDDSQGSDNGGVSKETPDPKYLVQTRGDQGTQGGAATPGKHGLTENQNYVPDTVPKKKACEFTPANCFCGARPTQQMDLLCASKKREYCGWFCKHKMGGREGKPKTGPDQYAGVAPKKLKPEKRASPEGCPKPSLKTCESIYSDPNSPDYVGDGYAPPGANCVCHIDQKTGHAVITDLPNSAALPSGNGKNVAAAPGAPAGTGAPAVATSGAPNELPNSNGAGPDSGGKVSGNAATDAINSYADSAVEGIQNVKDQANAAGQAASDTVQAASDAAGKVEEESKGMWHHAKGLAKAAGGHIANAASSVWNGVSNVGKAIFGDEAEAEVQGGYEGGDSDLEYSFQGGRDTTNAQQPQRGEHPTREETSVSNGLDEVFEDDEVALGSDFGIH